MLASPPPASSRVSQDQRGASPLLRKARVWLHFRQAKIVDVCVALGQTEVDCFEVISKGANWIAIRSFFGTNLVVLPRRLGSDEPVE